MKTARSFLDFEFGVRAFAVLIITLFCIGSVLRIFVAPPDLPPVRDWSAFYQAGKLIWAGTPEKLYDFSLYPTGFQFVYPPPVALILAPLGALTSSEAQWIIYGVNWLVVVILLIQIKRLFAYKQASWITFSLVTLASPFWLSTAITGQLSALFLLAMLVAIIVAQKGANFFSGVVSSILLLKPTIGIPYLVYMAVRSQWRIVTGILIGAFGLYGIGLFIHPAIWDEYYGAVVRHYQIFQTADFESWKYLTLYSSLRSFGSSYLIEIVWCFLAILGFVSLIFFTKKLPPTHTGALSLLVLFIITFNQYLYFYDGVLMLVPAAFWYQRFIRSNGAERDIGILIVLIYIFELLQLFKLQSSNIPLTGVLILSWYIFAGLSCLRERYKV